MHQTDSLIAMIAALDDLERPIDAAMRLAIRAALVTLQSMPTEVPVASIKLTRFHAMLALGLQRKYGSQLSQDTAIRAVLGADATDALVTRVRKAMQTVANEFDDRPTPMISPAFFKRAEERLPKSIRDRPIGK